MTLTAAPRSVRPATRRGSPHRAPLRAAVVLLTGVVLGGCSGLGSGGFRFPGPGDTGQVADDPSPLSADVQAALADTPLTMHERIHVQAMRDGRVRLTGYVGSSSAASEAVRVAGRVVGVSDVFDTMSVR